MSFGGGAWFCVTHFYYHSLNLAANDYAKNTKVMKSSLEVTHEITKLIKLSPSYVS